MKYIDWQRRLLTTIEAAKQRPFSWGENDCCLFASDCVVAQCDCDPAADYRGKYDTANGARKALLQRHGSIIKAFDAALSAINPAMVQRGDVVAFDGPLGVTAGVFWAGRVWAMSESGLIDLDVKITHAWRVG